VTITLKFFEEFIDSFFQLCYIHTVFVKVSKVNRVICLEAEKGKNSFFGFFA